MSAGSACVTCTTRQFGIGKTSFINHYILFNLKKFQIPETGHSTQSAEEPPDRGKIRRPAGPDDRPELRVLLRRALGPHALRRERRSADRRRGRPAAGTRPEAVKSIARAER